MENKTSSDKKLFYTETNKLIMNQVIKKIIGYLHSRKYILLFSLGYFLIKLIKLDSYFFLRDERDLILSALSLAQTGKDLYGNAFPLIFTRISPQTPLLGMYWAVPIVYFFHITSPILVKSIFILPTLFFPILIYELFMSITKEKKLSLVGACIVSFSPWYFHTSRLVMDSQLAYFLCLIGLICYIYKRKVMGLFFLMFSYFSYFGIRPFILVIIPYIEVWSFILSTKRKWKQTVFSLTIFILLFGCIFAFGSRIENTTSRSNAEILLLNKEKLTQDTNFFRAVSDAPFVAQKFFDNKATIILQSISYNFFKGIDFSYLFFTGDYLAIYSNQVTGQYFPFLIVFIILGICYIAKKKNRNYYFLAGFSLIGLVSSLINSYSITFSIRAAFSLVGIGFICALGIIYSCELLKKRGMIIFVLVTMFFYSIFTTFFIYKYFFQSYKMTNELFNEKERFIANFSKDNEVRTIFVPNIHSYFLSYLSTLPSLSPKIFNQIQKELNKPNGYVLDGHKFLQCNSEQISIAPLDTFPVSTLIEETCLSAKTKTYIELSKPKNIFKLLNPQYNIGDINRGVKYYYFK